MFNKFMFLFSILKQAAKGAEQLKSFEIAKMNLRQRYADPLMRENHAFM